MSHCENSHAFSDRTRAAQIQTPFLHYCLTLMVIIDNIFILVLVGRGDVGG